MVEVKNKILVDHKSSGQFETLNYKSNNLGIFYLAMQQLYEMMDL